uniref:Putative malate:quinone oxidoreductase n=1 Tax=Lygus hesperus TaxID=30085 RepID=A0A0A9XVB7_LYGHE
MSGIIFSKHQHQLQQNQDNLLRESIYGLMNETGNGCGGGGNGSNVPITSKLLEASMRLTGHMIKLEDGKNARRESTAEREACKQTPQLLSHVGTNKNMTASLQSNDVSVSNGHHHNHESHIVDKDEYSASS